MIKVIILLCFNFLIFSASLAQDQVTGADITQSNSSDHGKFEITLTTEEPELPLYADTPFHWGLIVRWYGGNSPVNPQIEKQPGFDNLKVLNSSTTLRTGMSESLPFSEKVFTYELIPLSEGLAVIGSAAIRYASADGVGQYLTTERKTYEVEPTPFSWSQFFRSIADNSIIRYVFLLIFIGLIIAVTLWFRRRRTKDVETEPVETVDPVQEALHAAQRARMEGNYSYFARELEHAVRHSLHQSFPETAPDSYEHYENLLDESRQKVLQRFSNQVQQVKYAPITASSETLEQLWNDAKRLIERES